MDFENDIRHGVYLKFGVLPQAMSWDLEFLWWGRWPRAISWQNHMDAQKQEKFKLREDVIEKLDKLNNACASVNKVADNVIGKCSSINEACNGIIESLEKVAPAGGGDALIDEVRRVPAFALYRKEYKLAR